MSEELVWVDAAKVIDQYTKKTNDYVAAKEMKWRNWLKKIKHKKLPESQESI